MTSADETLDAALMPQEREQMETAQYHADKNPSEFWAEYVNQLNAIIYRLCDANEMLARLAVSSSTRQE